ncbi:hypothetical protein AB833_02765 [Chromatiales bacterium (ex Bugula neritina AB1)]|nr:hypothetical protein AB833_02765 [Chromatiales bacterium (ex Bugula neritina AB1)]
MNNEVLCLELRESGINEDPAELVLRYRGWKLAAVLEELQELHCKSLPAGFTSTFREHAKIRLEQSLNAIPDVTEALAALDYPKCVASNAPVEKIHTALTATGLAGFFDSNIFSAYEVGSWKPEPGLFLHAADSMGFDVTDCIVVEDSDIGVQAAVAAGIPVVLYDPTQRVEQSEEAIVIHSMSQLPDIVGGLFAS